MGSIICSVCDTKQELFKRCLSDRREMGQTDISYSYFMRIWRKHRSSIKAKSGTDFMKCYACTQHKAVLYGTPGIRATVDGQAREEADRVYKEHIKVSTERWEVVRQVDGCLFVWMCGTLPHFLLLA